MTLNEQEEKGLGELMYELLKNATWTKESEMSEYLEKHGYTVERTRSDFVVVTNHAACSYILKIGHNEDSKLFFENIQTFPYNVNNVDWSALKWREDSQTWWDQNPRS